MSPIDDGALLKQYVENHSDAAFAELVSRHLNLVYSVAQRCVGDPHLAEEVSQAVFIILARKAAQLRHDKALSSWLFQTTRLTAGNFIRGQTRRHRREQEAYMQSVLNESGSDVWPGIAPLLDDAVAELAESDRQAVMLRFYEGRNFRQVGAALGASENAAQKRVSCAVERLREYFAKHGVTVGAGGLAAVLSANAVQAAPVGLAATISTFAVLAGTSVATPMASITTIKIMSPAVLKPIIVASAAIAASIVITVQHNHAGQLREQNEALHAQIQKTEVASAELSERLRALAGQTENDPRQAEILRLRSEVTRLRGAETELAALREESRRLWEQDRSTTDKQAAAQEAVQKFEGRRAETANAMKLLGLQLRTLAAQNNLNTAFTAGGKLNPALLAASLAKFDLGGVELLANDPSQLGKILAESPQTIVARTAKPILTPYGQWLHVYTMADGGVQSFSSDFPNQAFAGTLDIQATKPQP